MRICVVSSQPAAAEPRARRHAIAAKQAMPGADVLLFDMAPQGAAPSEPACLAAAGVRRRTAPFPTRRSDAPALVARKLRVALARARRRMTGALTEPVFSDWVIGLTDHLKRVSADVYIAHHVDTFLPAAAAADANGAQLVADCMEYYSDMGDGQSLFDARACKAIEAEVLPRCALVTASSDALADALASEYAIPRPTPLYNTPAVVRALPAKDAGGFRLYWRNAVVGLGQRGLDDALLAMSELPEDVTLHLQGRMPMDGGRRLRRRICELRLGDRVRFVEPYTDGRAVENAAPYAVGLCLERAKPINHQYTVSNKLFDYMMAGLAVVVSDLPGLRMIVDRSQGGLVFEPGSPASLRSQIARLHADRELVESLAARARAYALEEGNLEVEMARFQAALTAAIQRERAPEPVA